MVDMNLELFFYNECGFSRSVLNTITNLKIKDKVVMKNIRENADHEQELIKLTGDSQVPTLVVDGKLMRESDKINGFLFDQFLD